MSDEPLPDGREMSYFTKVGLQKELGDRGLHTKGNKKELYERLKEYMLANEAPVVAGGGGGGEAAVAGGSAGRGKSQSRVKSRSKNQPVKPTVARQPVTIAQILNEVQHNAELMRGASLEESEADSPPKRRRSARLSESANKAITTEPRIHTRAAEEPQKHTNGDAPPPQAELAAPQSLQSDKENTSAGAAAGEKEDEQRQVMAPPPFPPRPVIRPVVNGHDMYHLPTTNVTTTLPREEPTKTDAAASEEKDEEQRRGKKRPLLLLNPKIAAMQSKLFPMGYVRPRKPVFDATAESATENEQPVFLTKSRPKQPNKRPPSSVASRISMKMQVALSMDAWKLLEPVDVISKLDARFSELIESKKWDERKEALETFHKLLTDNPRLDPNQNYNKPVDLLKRLLEKDSHILVRSMAAKCLTGLARGLRTNFAPYASAVATIVFERFKEKKHRLRDSLVECIHAVYAATNLAVICKETMAAMQKPNPQINAQVDLFLYEVFKKFDATTAPKKGLKALLPILNKHTREPNPEVRDAACAALGAIIKAIGRPFDEHIEFLHKQLGKLKTDKTKKFYEKAVAEAGVEEANATLQPIHKPDASFSEKPEAAAPVNVVKEPPIPKPPQNNTSAPLPKGTAATTTASATASKPSAATSTDVTQPPVTISAAATQKGQAKPRTPVPVTSSSSTTTTSHRSTATTSYSSSTGWVSRREMQHEIDALQATMQQQINALQAVMQQKIDAQQADMQQKIDALQAQVERLQKQLASSEQTL